MLQGPVGVSLIGFYAEGQLGRGKTDLEVRNTDWLRDVASVIQLEFSFFFLADESLLSLSVALSQRLVKNSTCCRSLFF